MPLTSIIRDGENLTLTVVGDYPVPQQRLWDAFADPRQLERFWGPPDYPVTLTRHEFRPGGRAEFVMRMPDGTRVPFAWEFVVVDPISSFVANDGDGDDTNVGGPSSMTASFETTATGSRVTIVNRFASLEALGTTAKDMEEGLRAALPQLDTVLDER